MGFQNTAGPDKEQAVTLRVHSDMSAFFNCRMDGYQDTLHRQFYRNCVISGTVDFIFGDAAAVFQNCLLIVRLPRAGQQTAVTAQGRLDRHETTGFVIQNCRIVPEKKLFPERKKVKSYLGRPWKDYSRTVIMETEIGDFIHAEGWLSWKGNVAPTIFFAEYNNRGPGARTSGRVKWPGFKVMPDKMEALQYTVGEFIQGTRWLTAMGVPFSHGLKH